ncbi:MAG TPA: tetratricopeptide repeat protein [Thermoanaerobaculia bacterium]|nr:tetratricopeptide repeat protein [Thermoanaerobaculia bacterium]
MGRHLTPAKLAELLGREQVRREDLVSLLSHLLETCTECRVALSRLIESRALDKDGPSPVEGALAHVADRRATVRRYQAIAERELRLLLKLPPAERRLRLGRAQSRFRNPALADLFIEESRRRVAGDPAAAYDLAECAHEVAVRLSHRAVGRSWAMTCMARADAYRANALRAMGELKRAEPTLTFALSLFTDEGNGDPLVEAELLQLTASLRREQRRFGDAESLLARALELYEECGDTAQVAHVLLVLGVVFFEAAELGKAIAITRQAAAAIDRAEDPRLFLCAEHNLVLFLAEAGEYREARERLTGAAPLYDGFADPGTQLRRHWVAGTIARGLGEPSTAEAELGLAQQGFVRQGLGFDAALVGLDLAILYAEEGRTEEVARLAEEMVPIFMAQDIHREATAAILLFQQAARQEVATAAMVSQILGYMRRVRTASSREEVS